MVTRKSHQKAISSANDYPGLSRRPIKLEAEPITSTKTFHSTHKVPLVNSERDNERVRKEMAKIDAMELSDVESPKWTTVKENYELLSRKRYLDIEDIEDVKRKVRDPSTNSSCTELN